ncbi:hypothetical protein H0X32_03000 [Patescibacteria group bacterium]|nr:hypothetical protein [Patescibacteria group bacterium]
MRGFSTLELLLALGLMTATIAAVLLITIALPASVADGHKERTAMNAASQLLTAQELLGRNSFNSILSLATSTTDEYVLSLSATLLPDGITKRLRAHVSWVDAKGRFRSSTLYSVLTDFKNTITPTLCDSVLMGDWSHPVMKTFSLQSGDLLPPGNGSSSYPISTLAVSSTTLIAGINSAQNKTDPTLFIFDLSSSTHPSYQSSIDTASTTKQGVNAIVVAGKYMYTANAGTPDFSTCVAGPACNQLQIFDIQDTHSPSLIESFQLATSTFPFATGSGGQSNAKSIAYSDGLIYLGLTKTGSALGNEFNIIDVHDPYAPVVLGSFPVGRTINRILISGALAYLATDDPFRDLMILDIHDPLRITQIGSYDALGTAGFGYARDIALSSTTLLLGRTYTPTGPALSILTVASTSAPTQLYSAVVPDLPNPVTIEGVIVRDFLAFILTPSSLLVLDISDPKHPARYVAPLQLPSGATGTALICRNNTLYIGSVGLDHTGYVSVVTAL